MRSNLLSLQNIASRQDIVQNRLATGLKVSSAIDNPSSYYTASSLNNRATDLTALLDAMSQGIQTIKAASEAIDSGTKFLEQAKAVANQALEKSADIAAKVSNEAELLAAIASGKEGLIVLENDIIMSENQTIQLQKGQSLVGAAYLGSSKKTSLTFNITDTTKNCIAADDNSLLSDFTVNYNTNTYNPTASVGAIYISGKKNVTVQNMDINVNNTVTGVSGSSGISAVLCRNNGSLIMKGTNNLNTQGEHRTYGLSVTANAAADIYGTLNIKTKGDYAFATVVNTKSQLNFKQYAVYNVSAPAYAAIINQGGRFICEENSSINTNAFFYCEMVSNTTTHTPNLIKIASGVTINSSYSYIFKLVLTNTSEGNRVEMDSGVKFSWKSDAYTGTWTNDKPVSIVNNTDKTLSYSPPDIPGITKVSDIFSGLPDIDAEMAKNKEPVDGYKADYAEDETQYQNLLRQYNNLMSDAFYKGINLLTGQNLKINFNEDRSSKIDVTGVKADSDSLGLKTKEWKTVDDIEKSISELEEAINSLRGFASQFGNYYSIITTRQDFTENLINVLEEGADKLTLADMNQESANMLALQTSQQLAVNSLSLASQASQSILRLF